MFKITKEGNKFDVTTFPWDNGGATPATYAELSYNESGYKVAFTSYETDIRAVETTHNSPVHEDSCVELFAAFAEGDKRYINIEVNPNGAAHCELGEGRGNRLQIDPADIDSLSIKTAVYEDRWTVSYNIPIEFIVKYLPDYKHGEGTVIRCNLYKCGDMTGHEHYGCFNKVDVPAPDFHRPEFFAEFKLS